MSREAQKARNLQKLIFGACRRAGIDTEARHAIQKRVTGKESLTAMSLKEMAAVHHAIRRGGNPDRKARRPPEAPCPLPAGAHRAKLRALWICARELGVVRDPHDDALASWMCRQTGMDAARWATPAQCSACIEALKDWMARDGGVDWRPYARSGKRPVHKPRARVLEALWRKLHEAGAVRIADLGALHSWVVGHRRGLGDCYSALDAKEQDKLIRELGKWLRKARR